MHACTRIRPSCLSHVLTWGKAEQSLVDRLRSLAVSNAAGTQGGRVVDTPKRDTPPNSSHVQQQQQQEEEEQPPAPEVSRCSMAHTSAHMHRTRLRAAKFPLAS